jgi:hypothetical protein
VSDWLGLPASGDPAAAILAFLVDRGLTVVRPWQDGVAEVRGAIPVEDVLARFCGPGSEAPAINRLEARPESIRILGPNFEEYLIRAV